MRGVSLVAALAGGLVGLFSAVTIAGAAATITPNPTNPSTATGVYFTVTTGGGNRDYASIAVSCTDVTGAEVYATVITVSVPPKGSGTSQTIFPPAGSCTADLEKLMQIGKAHILASTSFTVSP